MTDRANFVEPDEPCALDQRSLEIMIAAARYQTARLARSLRLSPAQREDVEQEILLILLERRHYFDATRGPWTAFAHRIARQAAQVIADQICLERRRMPLSLDHTLGGACEEGDEGAISLADMLRDAHALPDEQALMSVAMDRFLTRLPPELSVTAMFVLERERRTDAGSAARRRRQIRPRHARSGAPCPGWDCEHTRVRPQRHAHHGAWLPSRCAIALCAGAGVLPKRVRCVR